MDQKLLHWLYQKYRREIYLYLHSLCHDPDMAEDLVQETFLKAILSLSDEHTNMRAWLYLVARNLYFNYARQKRTDICMEDLKNQKHAPEQDPRSPDALEQVIRDERKRMLYDALRRLPAAKREVLVLQYFSGFTQKEIARLLHITPENVRVLAYRGKQELRKIMEVNGYDIS